MSSLLGGACGTSKQYTYPTEQVRGVGSLCRALHTSPEYLRIRPNVRSSRVVMMNVLEDSIVYYLENNQVYEVPRHDSFDVELRVYPCSD